MKVRYKCNQCPVDAEVEVPERAKALDLMFWMRIVQQKVANDHLTRTGENHGTCDLMIPVDPDSDMVGKAPK